MDVREIRQMNDEQLLDQLEDLKEAMFNLRFQEAYGQLEDARSITRTKRDVARVLTVMRERQIEAARKEVNNG